MKGDLKMSDVFSGKARLDFDGRLSDDKVYHGTLDDFDDASIDATIHAINSHDELVENMQHYKQEAEQWGARATKESSRARDLEREVDRLCEIIMLAIEVNESMASAVPETDWGSGFKECATATSKALMETANKQSPKWVAYQMAKRGK